MANINSNITLPATYSTEPAQEIIIPTSSLESLPNRLFVSGTLNAIDKSLKSALESYFLKAKLGAVIERPSKEGTAFSFEGLERKVHQAKIDIQNLLIAYFPGVEVVYSEPQESTVDRRLEKVTVKQTAEDLWRTGSSGEFRETDMDLYDDSVSITSSFQQFMENLHPKQWLIFAQRSRRVYSTFQSAVSTVINKNVSVSFNNTSVTLNIGPCVAWDDFITLVKENGRLKIGEEKIDGIYTVIDKRKEYIQEDLQVLTAGTHYFVETESSLNETKPKFTTLEEFFKALKDKEGLEDDDVALVKDVFAKQKLKFKQLMKTGDLAITDAELEKYGIAQGGLRKAILSLIKSDRK